MRAMFIHKSRTATLQIVYAGGDECNNFMMEHLKNMDDWMMYYGDSEDKLG